MMEQVPDDLLIDIFCRLPTESILRCKVVCKSWHDILEQEAFIEAHLYRCYRTDFLHPILLHFNSFRLYDGDGGPDLTFYQLKLADTRRTSIFRFSAAEVDIGINDMVWLVSMHDDVEGLLVRAPRYSFENFRGTCKGLVLCGPYSVYCCLFQSYICNPATYERWELPRMAHNKWQKCKKFVLTGMGFDPVTKLYKVVQMWYSHRHGLEWELEALIHVVGTPSWRKIRVGLDPVPIVGQPGVFAGGALHWMAGAELGRSGRLDRIVSLDMNDESFGVIPWPENGPAKEHHCNMLSEWKGRLSVASICDADDVIEIWVLLKGKDWVKQVKMEYGGVCKPPWHEAGDGAVAGAQANWEFFLCQPDLRKCSCYFDFESGSASKLPFQSWGPPRLHLDNWGWAHMLKDVGYFALESHVTSLVTLKRYFHKKLC